MSDSEECVNESAILESRKRMENEYPKNVDKLYKDICLTVRRQVGDKQSEYFYISQLKFTNGSAFENYPDDHTSFMNRLAEDLNKMAEKESSRNAETIEKMKKLGKNVPDSVRNFVPFENITVVLRFYTITHLVVFITGKNAVKMYEYLSNIYANKMEGYGNTNGYFIFLSNKFFNVMNEDDEVHRYGYRYYLDNGVIRRDDEEEMIFGDDFLGNA